MRTAQSQPSGSSFTRSTARVLGASGAVLALGGSLAVAAPAFAYGTCPSDATTLSNGVCQIAFTENTTWTPPAGVTALEALLVGGGGAGDGYYGGGGGDVRIVTLDTSGDIDIVVGPNGVVGSDADGGASTVTQGSTFEAANGGNAGVTYSGGGISGSGFSGFYAGGGAGGAASGTTGGIGVVPADLDSTLFTDMDTCVGGGGAGFSESGVEPSTCGGGYLASMIANTVTDGDPNVWIADTGSAVSVDPIPNSGGGGHPYPLFDTTNRYYTVGADGAAGVVIFRFTMAGDASTPSTPSAALATTGAQALPLGMFAAGLGLTGVSLALARRARRA